MSNFIGICFLLGFCYAAYRFVYKRRADRRNALGGGGGGKGKSLEQQK